MSRLPLALLALALTGCAGTQHRNAADALAERVGDDVAVSCTRAARVGYLHELDTKEFLCLARRGTADCDRYRVTRQEGRYAVQLLERRADCILPPS